MEAGITIQLKDDREEFTPGEVMTGTVEWCAFSESPLPAELSVLWYTEGKGDQDSGVVYFEQLSLAERGSHPFSFELPMLPLTYHGELIKIHWVVRVRLQAKWKSDVFFEMPFTLRAIPAEPTQG